METTEEIDTISRHPIKDGLVAFRRQFEPSGALEDVLSTESGSDLVLDVIGALQNLPAARVLRSRIDRNTRLRADLFSLGSQVSSSVFDIKSVIPLIGLVISNAPDAEIWSAVFDLVTRTRPTATTPPTAFENAIFDTPLRSSSASQGGNEQTHEEVDNRVLEELTGRVYCDVKGFYKRYFEEKDWSNNANVIYEESRVQYSEGHWNDWPEPPLQNLFFDWFIRMQDTILGGLRCKYYTSANKVLRGSEADRKLDIFLAPADVAFEDSEHDWSNVLVIGEHKQNPNEDRSIKTLVQLAGYAREVFGSQPDRRFVPGFTICGSLMRLWMFDRSGSYSSEKFDIHEEPEQFINVISGYALMSDAELGLNTFIKRHGNGKYIITRGVRICLEDQPIAWTKAIVCRGTTCYRGRRADSEEWEYVVKFAWPSDKRQREGWLLKLAMERKVTGIAQWFNHEQITIGDDPDTISHLRRVMTFGVPRTLSSKAFWVESGTRSSRASRPSVVRGRSKSRSKSSMSRQIDLSSGQKRKRDNRLVTGMKRSKSGDSQTSVVVVGAAVEENASDTGDIYSVDDSVEDSVEDSLAGVESEAYGNRIHCCLVISPAGRPLHAYTTVTELLEVLRDAIAGHKSLLEDGKILHRDISENNIIIVELIGDGGPRGRLIDLDLAKELDSLPSGASHRTGTMQFMAIEVLQGKGHTYRHDLESFFYVLIWMCIRYGHEDVTGVFAPHGSTAKKRRTKVIFTSRLQGWYSGTYSEIGRNKLGDMDKNGFEGIVAEFSPQFNNLKQLARELRTVLFPIRDGAIFTGTFRETGIMYDGMINAFNKAISELVKE